MAGITAPTAAEPTVPAASPGGAPRRTMLRKLLLACGVGASLLYVAADIRAGRQWAGYSYTDQTISELGAIGAPTRPLGVALGIAYDLLVYAFGVGVWASANGKRALRVAAVGMVGKEVLGLAVNLFSPMHQRAVLAAGGGTLTDELHRDLTMVGVLSMLVAMVAGATAVGKGFRGYTIATILAFVVGAAVAFGQAPDMAANLPTPGQGLAERLNAYGYMLWVVVLASALLRAQRKRPQDAERPASMRTPVPVAS